MVKKIAFLCLIFLLYSVFTAGDLAASVYYVSPSGADGNNGTRENPWKSFMRAMVKMRPGDTLVLKNGLYLSPLEITRSGEPGRPLVFRAEQDGGATVDGRSVYVPLRIRAETDSPAVHDITVEGIVFMNSPEDVVAITNAKRIKLLRVSAYNAGTGNFHVFSLWNMEDSLLEDTAASGTGRQMYDLLSTKRVTLRRCWGRWMAHDGGGGPNGLVQVYGSDDTIVENCVGTMDGNASDSQVQGIVVWAHTYNKSADRNRIYGNVIYGLTFWGFFASSALNPITGNKFMDDVSINNTYGFMQRADSDLRVERFTIAGSKVAVYVSELPGAKANGFRLGASITNSIFIRCGSGLSVKRGLNPVSVKSGDNVYYGLRQNYLGEISEGKGDSRNDPGFETDRYGNGAYLFVPEIMEKRLQNVGGPGGRGAQVLYRYLDGRLTKIPLWPWPMEERILSETGVSVTWQKKGGIWKTLEGIYPKPNLPRSAKN